jgi:integrase
MTDHIIKQNTRILMPTEYQKLRAVMNSNYQLICDALLLSGMRPIEFQRMEKSWYRAPRRCVELPKGACLKEKCEYKERTIMLSLPGCDALDAFLNSGVKKPGKVSMRDTLRRYAITSGIGADGITSKMFRKTLASWLVACYEDKYLSIAASMGHDVDTLQKHYLGIAFPMAEIELMKTKYLNEWGLRL